MTGAYNRAQKKGLNVYCNKVCSGIGRRTDKAPEQKKIEKAEYDAKYREAMADKLKLDKAEWFKKYYTANPEKYRQRRKDGMERHLQYLSRPEYKQWKANYDKKYLSQKKYGAFAEAAIILRELEKYIDRYEARLLKGTFNKTKKRKQNVKSINSNQFEKHPLGNTTGRKGW